MRFSGKGTNQDSFRQRIGKKEEGLKEGRKGEEGSKKGGKSLNGVRS